MTAELINATENGSDLELTFRNNNDVAVFRLDTTMMGYPEGNFGYEIRGVFSPDNSADCDLEDELRRLEKFKEEHEAEFWITPELVSFNNISAEDMESQRDAFEAIFGEGVDVGDQIFDERFNDPRSFLTHCESSAGLYEEICVGDGSSTENYVYENYLADLKEMIEREKSGEYEYY